MKKILISILTLLLSLTAVTMFACTDEDANKCTITFVQTGYANIVKTVEKGGDLTDVPAVRNDKVGYVIEWDRTDFTNITSNITVTAVATPITSTVTIKVDLSNPSLDVEEDFTYDQAYDLDEIVSPSKAGYEFDGWFIYGSNVSVDVDGIWTGLENLTIYAKWSALPQTITIKGISKSDLQDKLSPAVSNVEGGIAFEIDSGEALEIPTLALGEGKKLVGYVDADGQLVNPSKITVNGPLTLTAKIAELNNPTDKIVTFNQENEEMQFVVVEANGTYSGLLPEITKTVPGYDAKWTTAGGDVFDDSYVVTEDITVTPKNTPKTITVTYDVSDSSVSISQEIVDKLGLERVGNTYIQKIVYGSNYQLADEIVNHKYKLTGWNDGTKDITEYSGSSFAYTENVTFTMNIVNQTDSEQAADDNFWSSNQ